YPPIEEAVREGELLIERALDEAKSRAAAQQSELISRRDGALLRAEKQHQAQTAETSQQRDSRLQSAGETYPRRLAETAALRDRGWASDPLWQSTCPHGSDSARRAARRSPGRIDAARFFVAGSAPVSTAAIAALEGPRQGPVASDRSRAGRHAAPAGEHSAR